MDACCMCIRNVPPSLDVRQAAKELGFWYSGYNCVVRVLEVSEVLLVLLYCLHTFVRFESS